MTVCNRPTSWSGSNPYGAVDQPDCFALWEALVARDSEAFAAKDWSLCADDFAADRFEGITANGSLDPLDWSLQYPTVESYRDDWLAMAEAFLKHQFTELSHRELLYKMQHFAKVEVASDRAVVWKRFSAVEPLANGDRYRIRAQSIYRLHRINQRWLIVGFVGYLPVEEGS